jgi:hypothetical protein
LPGGASTLVVGLEMRHKMGFQGLMMGEER